MGIQEDLLPDPHEHDWERCLGIYRYHRTYGLGFAREVRRLLREVDQALVEVEGKTYIVGEVTRLQDRGNVLRVNLSNVQGQLCALRDWLNICRAAHGKVDRALYLAREHAHTLGVPFEVAVALYRRLIGHYGTHEFARVTNADEFSERATKWLHEVVVEQMSHAMDRLHNPDPEADAQADAEALWQRFLATRQ